jgi:hypothetical protein
VVFPSVEAHVAAILCLSPLAFPDVVLSIRRVLWEVWRYVPLCSVVELTNDRPNIANSSTRICIASLRR